MTTQARPPDGRGDDDGVRIVPTPRGRRAFWWIGVAVALPVIATVLAVAIIRLSADAQAPAPPPFVARAEAGATAAAPTSADEARRPAPAPVASRIPGRVVPRRVGGAEPAGLGASPVPKPEKPRREIDAASAIQALRDEGVHDGIAAFGLPGFHPPTAGILVPEEYELPEGYVRHYQSTDDGEQLPAILMFHPDYEFVDEHGNVVKLPEDGVVPPEMAPPGIDVDQVLQVPARKAGEPVR